MPAKTETRGRKKKRPQPLRAMQVRFNNREQLGFVRDQLAAVNEAKGNERNIESVIEVLEEMKGMIVSKGVVFK